MTVIADIKKVIAPFMAMNNTLFQRKRLIAFKPVNHILKGFAIDRSSTKGAFFIRWFAMPMFELSYQEYFNYGAHVYKETPGLWHYDAEETPELLAKNVEETAWPVLNSIITIHDFYKFAMQENYFHADSLAYKEMTKIAVEAAMGYFGAADKTSQYLLKEPNRWSIEPSVKEKYFQVTQCLCPLVKERDKEGIAALLHEWEQKTITNLKLEKYWQATPFPIEI
jgi:hypothetical protein